MVVYTNATYTDKKRIRRRRWKLRLFAILLFSVLGGISYLVFFTPMFRFREVRIVGNRILQPTDIFNAQRHPYLWDSIAIEHAGIGKTKVEKDILRRTLTIQIEERIKYGVWCGADLTVCYWFDAEGVLFAEAPDVEGMLIPKLLDMSGKTLRTGDLISEERFVANVLRIFDVLKKADMPVEELKIEDDSRQEVIAELVSGPRIYFSMRFDPSSTHEPLKALKGKFSSISYIDLRAENKVYYK